MALEQKAQSDFGHGLLSLTNVARKIFSWEFPGGQWVGLRTSTTRVEDSTPGWGTKIPHIYIKFFPDLKKNGFSSLRYTNSSNVRFSLERGVSQWSAFHTFPLG